MWVGETFPDNLIRAIAENNLRDGLNKMAEFVFETNSSESIANALTAIEAKKTESLQRYLAAEGLYLAMVDLKAYVQAFAEQGAVIGEPLGGWDPAVNAQGLTATPDAELSENSVYEIIDDGVAPFGGTGFEAGDLLASGGRLFKRGTLWFYQKPTNLAFSKALSIEERIAGIFATLLDGLFVSDESGNVIFEITDKVSYFGQVTMEMFQELSGRVVDFLDLYPEDLFVCDGDGNVIFEVVDGEVNFPGVGGGQVGATILESEFPSDMIQIIVDGQSLSTGGTTASPTDLYDAKTFVGGLLTSYDPADATVRNAYYGTDFINLSQTGSDPGKGMVKVLKDLIRDENGIAAADQHFTPILNAGGISGASYATLADVNGISYKRIIESVKYAQDFAVAAGKSFCVPAFCYIQGENTGDRDDTLTEWYGKLETLFNSFNTDIKAITGQSADVNFFTYQIASGITEPKFLEMPLAQLKISRDKANVHMGATMYQLGYADALHLDNLSYRLMWAAMGVALKRAVVDKKKHEPIRPLSWQVNKNQAANKFCINMKMHVPSGSLVFDETVNAKYTTAPINKGFSIKNSGGAEIITTVSISRGNTLNIICSENPTGLELTYAAQGRISGGNLRDTQGDNIKVPFEGTLYRVDNWCPIFKQVI